MKLYEYEAKEIARRHGIPVPRGGVAYTPEEARRIAEELGARGYAVKAQVLVGRRGLAGGVKLVDTPEDVYSAAELLLNTRIRGVPVEAVLVEEKVGIKRELYVAMTVDRAGRRIVLLASPLGGVEIEELVREHPDQLLRISIDPAEGLQPYMARWAAVFLGLDRDLWKQFGGIVGGMWSIMKELDAELVEFNPLAVTDDGLVAVDAKINIDDNSLYRHPDFAEKALREYSGLERRAREMGFSYVELGGDIGILCNGAGLTMATMDLVSYYGGRPANFLDIGGGAKRERVREAVKLLLTHPSLKVLLVNIFGGITRCDEVAGGIVDALRETGSGIPIVARVLGTNEEEGRRILAENGIDVYTEIDEAVKRAVEIARGEG